jgi:hypothetical protein
VVVYATFITPPGKDVVVTVIPKGGGTVLFVPPQCTIITIRLKLPRKHAIRPIPRIIDPTPFQLGDTPTRKDGQGYKSFLRAIQTDSATTD